MHNEQFGARIASIVLGVWLIVSAFLWMHTASQQSNALVCGLLAIVFSMIAMRVPDARYLNTALAVWLVVSAWALPSLRAGTTWNHVLVGLALFIVSLVPVRPVVRPVTPPRG